MLLNIPSEIRHDILALYVIGVVFIMLIVVCQFSVSLFVNVISQKSLDAFAWNFWQALR